MYEAIWRAVKGELSGVRAKEYVERLWRHARWNSFDRMQDTASEIAAIMREIGLEEVEVIRYPADGVTSYGGWVMPEAWDVEDATLEIAEPEVAEPVLAHYRDCPQSLMMYSAPTPPEGVVAELVAVDEAGKDASYQGRDVRDKLVLADGLGIEMASQAFGRGAVGLVSDYMRLTGSPQDKGDGSLDRACQWHNYTIPPWRWEKKRFGFSISPEAGRRLRELLRTHASVKLRALVRTRLYEGSLPLVTGLLPGKTREEIVLTGHLCEPGANDNSSGVALGLEAVRCVRELSRKGDLGPLERGLRPIYSFEVRGYQAFLGGNGVRNRLCEAPCGPSRRTVPDTVSTKRFVAGINLDMVGNDLSDARSVCNLIYNFPTLPAYTDFLALELLRRLEREDGLFRFRTNQGALVDNLFGEPSVGAPMCVLGAWPDAYYHNSLDGPENISPDGLGAIGRVTATYCYFLATAGFPEAVWLARLVRRHAEEEILEAARGSAAGERIDGLTEKNVGRLLSIGRLVRPRGTILTREDLEKNAEWRCPASGLFKDAELRLYLERHSERLRESARRVREAVCADERYVEEIGASVRKDADRPKDRKDSSDSAGEEERAKRLVPLRTFRGSLCFESLDEDARRDLKERTGLTVSWGAPYWLQLAMFLSDGKRTALDIHRRLRRERVGVSLPGLTGALEFLADCGFVKLRPILTKDDYLAALREVGVGEGSVVHPFTVRRAHGALSRGPKGSVYIVHSSLSRFGYVEGGAETVIGALLEALGAAGTLVMPTFTCSFAGRPPFDPERTPSRVGAITEAFRRRTGVLRSPHPTHSVAAFGPKAGEITRVHSPDRPVFSGEGAFGKLYELDAWILMLAPIKSNTCMHMGEERAGVPLRDAVAHVAEKGGSEIGEAAHMDFGELGSAACGELATGSRAAEPFSKEVALVHAPLHTNSFDEHYRALFERELVRAAPLGEEKIYLMRLRDAVDVALENLRRDPLLAAAEGCDCETCRKVREKAGRADS